MIQPINDGSNYLDNFNDSVIVNKDLNISISLKEIEQYIQDLCPDFFVDDLTKCSLSTYKGILRMTGQHFFKRSHILYNINKSFDKSFINQPIYNYNLLNGICLDFYNYLCEKYNKVKSLECYCLLYTIPDDYILQEKSNPDYSRLFAKIQNSRTNSLKDKLIDSKNVVGALAVFNDENNRTITGENRRPDNVALISSINQNKLIETDN